MDVTPCDWLAKFMAWPLVQISDSYFYSIKMKQCWYCSRMGNTFFQSLIHDWIHNTSCWSFFRYCPSCSTISRYQGRSETGPSSTVGRATQFQQHVSQQGGCLIAGTPAGNLQWPDDGQEHWPSGTSCILHVSMTHQMLMSWIRYWPK